jgi:hypothetical protein
MHAHRIRIGKRPQSGACFPSSDHLADEEETGMLQATKRNWAPAGMTPGAVFRPLRRFIERLFRPDRTAVEDQPPELRTDLGILDGGPPRDRTEAYFSDPRRHGDWLRSGPL